jgi:hypothetical protein
LSPFFSPVFWHPWPQLRRSVPVTITVQLNNVSPPLLQWFTFLSTQYINRHLTYASAHTCTAAVLSSCASRVTDKACLNGNITSTECACNSEINVSVPVFKCFYDNCNAQIGQGMAVAYSLECIGGLGVCVLSCCLSSSDQISACVDRTLHPAKLLRALPSACHKS